MVHVIGFVETIIKIVNARYSAICLDPKNIMTLFKAHVCDMCDGMKSKHAI